MHYTYLALEGFHCIAEGKGDEDHTSFARVTNNYSNHAPTSTERKAIEDRRFCRAVESYHTPGFKVYLLTQDNITCCRKPSCTELSVCYIFITPSLLML